MTGDLQTALEGIAEYIENRIALPTREATARLYEGGWHGSDDDLVSILHDFAVDCLTLAFEALEANAVEMIGQ
ncbi:MAG: hypothetical protein ACRDH7_05710 [Actinomycetota bacterium]